MCWSKVTLSHNGKNNTLPYYFFNAIQFLGFYIKNSNKKLFCNKKYIAKITNPITKPVFDNYKADISWNKISRKK